MAKFDDEIAHRKKQNRLDEVALKDIQAGKSKSVEGLCDAQQVGVTDATIKTLKSRIAKTGRLIKWYEKVNARRS